MVVFNNNIETLSFINISHYGTRCKENMVEELVQGSQLFSTFTDSILH